MLNAVKHLYGNYKYEIANAQDDIVTQSVSPGSGRLVLLWLQALNFILEGRNMNPFKILNRLFSRTSIGKILAMSFGFFVFLAAAMGVIWIVSVVKTEQLEHKANEMIELNAHIAKMQTAHYKWMGSLTTAVNEGSEFTGELDYTKCEFGKWYYSFKMNDPDLKEPFEALEEPHKKLHEAGKIAQQLIRDAKFSEAKAAVEYAQSSVLTVLMDKYEELAERMKKKHEFYGAELDRIYAAARFLAVAMVIIVVVLAVTFTLVLTKNIGKPLKNIKEVAAKIAEGDLSQQIESDQENLTSKNEVVHLSAIFSKMTLELRKLVVRAELIANGEIGADEVEQKMKNGLGLEEAAAVITGKGDLDSAFDKMQGQLRKLTVQARRIAADDLNNSVLNSRISGELGDAFAKMKENLKGFAKTAEMIAEGNLKTGSANASAQGVLSGQFAKMSENLRILINEVKKQTNLISNASVSLAQVSSQSSQTISQLSSTVTQISSATTSIAQNSQSSSTAANAADGAGRKGKELMGKLVEKIGIIKSTTETSAKAMDSLSTRSAQIGDIVSVITKIADQTNLLSLNAAIEAARAGEAGRGFAVVADEVRKLAENSASSAQDISRIIGEVQGETKSAVESVKGGQKEIEEGAALTGEASAKFGDIVVQIDGIAHQVEEIAASAEETAASAEEASASSEEQTAGIEEVTASAAQLADNVKALQQAVSKFSV